MDIEQRDLEAFLFECVERMQNRMMLKRGRDDMLFAFFGTECRSGAQRLIIRLAAAGCEGDLLRVGVQAACDACAGILKQLLRRLPEGIQARWIAVNLRQAGEHCRERRFADLGRCSVIRIDHG